MRVDGARRLTGKAAARCGLAIMGTVVLGALLSRKSREKGVILSAPGDAVPAGAHPAAQPSKSASGSATANQISARAGMSPSVTLSKFVEQNEKLFGVLGVFTAVSVFVGQLRLRWFAYGLSLVFMLLVVLLWIELWSKFPHGSNGFMITVFEDLLSLAVLGLVAYSLIDYRDIWHQYLGIPILVLIWSITMGGVSWFIKKHDIFNRLFRTVPKGKAVLRYLVAISISAIALYFSVLLGQLIAAAANRVLDAWYKALSQ